MVKSPELTLSIKPHTGDIAPYISFRMIIGLYFFIAVLNIKKIKNNNFWLGLIIAVGLISRIILIPSQPVLEDDYYRYMWDGAVTANGYNPYVYSPEAAMDFTNGDVPEELHELANESGKIVKNINHPHIRTIYPILSQIVFATAYFISPWEYWAWKVLLLLFDIALLLVLIKTLQALKLPLLFVVFYWLNPIVIHEIFNGAHMDILAMLFVSLSLYLSIKNKTWFAVVALALAVGFKLWPLVLLPLLLRNYWQDKKLLLKFIGGFAGLVLIFFIPVLVSTLDDTLGFIKYAGKWINNAAIYSMFQWLVQGIISLLQIGVSCSACINRWGIFIIYMFICAIILRKSYQNNLQFFHKALLIVAVLYLISPTQFPWYYTWMVPLLAIRPKVSLLLYPLLLPLYQLKYLGDYIIYIEHIPVLILFVLEIKGVIWKDWFNFMSIGKEIKINTS
ncbi:glycosyltransferase 87 family protein [Bacteroidota bacterium]